MAVQVQFITIIVPIEWINASTEPGGFAGLLEREAALVGKAIWHDEHLYATAVMNPMDAQRIAQEWEAKSLVLRTSTDESRQWKDLCIVNYYQGPTLPCDWLEWDAGSHSVWPKGAEPGEIVKPIRQHEANPVQLTPAMIKKLGKHIHVVGGLPARKPWWKFW